MLENISLNNMTSDLEKNIVIIANLFILSQTHTTFKMIVFDDCSTNGS